MIIAKQMEIRDNIKKYFDFAHDGEPIIVPRKQNKNVVIISESEYNRLNQALRMAAYSNSLSTQSGKTADDNTLCSDIKSENLNKLEKISGLKENWNGNGASPFSKTVIKKVRALIKALLIQPEVFPTALNTIQFEYDNSRQHRPQWSEAVLFHEYPISASQHQEGYHYGKRGFQRSLHLFPGYLKLLSFHFKLHSYSLTEFSLMNCSRISAASPIISGQGLFL